MASTIKVDNIQNSAGQDLLVNGYPRQPGSIIEVLTSPCDGSTVTVGSGTYTIQNVTTQLGLTDSYVDIPGSTISYTPPPGTTRVIYSFTFQNYSVTTHDIIHFKFFIGNDEVVYARHNRSAQYLEMNAPFTWTIPIGGIANVNTGRQSGWTTPKTLKMQVRRYGASNYGNLFGTRYWDGGGTNYFSMPTLTITAIA